MLNHTARLAACLSIVLVLSACSVLGPDFTAPEATTPAAFALTGKTDGRSVPVAEKIDPKWWRLFNDPVLTSLEERLTEGNFDLRTASLRLVQARAQLGFVSAAGLPTLGVSGSANEVLTSARGPFMLPSRSTSQPPGPQQFHATPDSKLFKPHEVYQAGFDAGWEIDLWGRVARTIESSAAQLEATAEARREIEVTASAELARDYILLRGTQRKTAITRENLGIAGRSLALTRDRAAGGVTTDLDVANAAAIVETIAAQLPALEQQQAALANAIALLLGAQPRALEVELAAPRALPPPPPLVPVGLPSDLARRRPDIRRAEATLHAATANIGVATADFYPRVMLTGSAGMQSLNLHQLLDSRAFFLNIGPSISMPIFDGGRVQRTVELREAQQQEAALLWQRSVLGALHEVDNALTDFDAEQRRRDRLLAADRENRRALALAAARYQQGVTDFLQVLIAQRNLLAAEQDLSDSLTAISGNMVQLYKALGGGWDMASN